MPNELGSKPGHLIWRTYQLTWQVFAEEAGPLEITPVQEALLLVLSRRSNVDQKTLAEVLALDRSTAGDVLDRLEKRGLLTRTENEADRRSRIVNLTRKGRLLSQKLRPIASRAADRLMAPLSAPERSEFVRLLRVIVGLADPIERISTAPPLASKLEGKQILCLGLSGDLGDTIVDRLQSEGADVDSILPGGQQADAATFQQEIQRIGNQLNGVEVLVNGGSSIYPPSLKEADGYFLGMQNLVNSRMAVLDHFVPQFIEKGRGSIINLGIFPSHDNPIGERNAAVSTNAAIAALTQLTAEEHRSSGVLCNALFPRFRAGGGTVGSWSRVPALDVAQAISFLASDAARSISGSNLTLG